MIDIPVLRWGKPYDSLEKDTVVHFDTGEELATVSLAGGGLIERDMRKAQRARDVLREIPPRDLIEMVQKAADLYMKDELPLGNGTQGPDDFVKYQSATTGLPEHMCRANMEKNHFVLTRMNEVLDALTRGLDLTILNNGYGVEERGVTLSYQAQTPVLGLVLPSNSPGVHTLWMPVIPLQIGLVFKPGPQEPWTPYRMAEAFFQAGVPRETISIYPGLGDIGAAVLKSCRRSMIFGGKPTVERYKGDPRVQVHGPGFSKILLGDDVVDDWENYLDVMVDSVLINSGRSCISWLRHLGVTPHEEDSGSHRGATRAGGAPLPGRPRKRARSLYRARCRGGHLERDRPAPRRGGERGRYPKVSRRGRSAARPTRTVRLFEAHRHPL